MSRERSRTVGRGEIELGTRTVGTSAVARDTVRRVARLLALGRVVQCELAHSLRRAFGLDEV